MEFNNSIIFHLFIITFFTLILFNTQAVSRSNSEFNIKTISKSKTHPVSHMGAMDSPDAAMPEDSPDSPMPEESPFPEDSPNQDTAKVMSKLPPVDVLGKGSAFKGLLNPEIASAPASTDNPTIQEMCKSTDHPELCISALTTFDKAKKNHDPMVIMEFAIKAIEMHTRMARDIASQQARLPQAVTVRSKLKDCKDIYEEVLGYLNDATTALKARDIGTVNTELSAVLDDFSRCGDELGGAGSSMFDFDDQLMKMASNCLAMSSFVKQ